MGDYIDREATIGYIEKKKRELGITNCNACNFKDILRAQPAADVRPVVRGRWVKQDDDQLDGNFYCSACHSRIDIATGLETPIDRGLFFCHSCGADMRGVGSDE